MSHPEVFYKYLSSAGADAVLRSARLRWSSPLIFDDPAEFRRVPRFRPPLNEAGDEFVRTLVGMTVGDASLDELRLSATTKFTLGLFRQLVSDGMGTELIREVGGIAPNADERFEALMKEFVERLTLETTRVLCLTTDRENDRMWQNYAERRRGAVLEFRHVPEYSTPLLAAKEVTYSAEPPIIGSGLDFLLYGDTPELRRCGLDAILYVKRADWAYQREWRAVTWRKDEGKALHGDYRFIDAELASVTIGSSASAEWARSIREFVKLRYPDCEILQD